MRDAAHGSRRQRTRASASSASRQPPAKASHGSGRARLARARRQRRAGRSSRSISAYTGARSLERRAAKKRPPVPAAIAASDGRIDVVALEAQAAARRAGAALHQDVLAGGADRDGVDAHPIAGGQRRRGLDRDGAGVVAPVGEQDRDAPGGRLRSRRRA